MDRRTMIALGILVSAAFGWYWFKVRGQQTDSAQEDADQSEALGNQENYAVPSQNAVQSGTSNVYTTQNGVTSVQSRQTMPLPYNT